ncbi:hypothetical protein SAMN05216330_1011320 [Bradyrhizobium sp. Ghvi]|nr:hypothetical protein SAMN05216330_1011320 [Bradyrhizobium sp. Ghvi]
MEVTATIQLEGRQHVAYCNGECGASVNAGL